MTPNPLAMTANDKPRVYELDAAGMATWCQQKGFPAYRAEQIRRWIFGRRANAFSEMHDLPAALRGEMEAEFSLLPARLVEHKLATDRTEKLLLELTDGQLIECVLMRENRSTDDLYFHASRMRHGLRFLRQRTAGAQAEFDDGRNP